MVEPFFMEPSVIRVDTRSVDWQLEASTAFPELKIQFVEPLK